MRKIILVFVLTLSLLGAFMTPVGAQVGCSGEDPNDAQNLQACNTCLGQGGIWTAIGCVDPSPVGIMTRLIQIGLGVMSGVAVLQFIYAGLMYQSGDEKKVAEARAQITATLTGMAVLVFSVLILEIIGVNILDIIPNNYL